MDREGCNGTPQNSSKGPRVLLLCLSVATFCSWHVSLETSLVRAQSVFPSTAVSETRQCSPPVIMISLGKVGTSNSPKGPTANSSFSSMLCTIAARSSALSFCHRSMARCNRNADLQEAALSRPMQLSALPRQGQGLEGCP